MKIQKTEENKIDGIMIILRGHGWVNLDDEIELKKAFAASDTERFEDYLIDEEIVEKDQLLQALGEFYNVRPFDVMGTMFDHHLMRMFPKNVLLNNCCIPYCHENDIMIIIAGDPSDENLDAVLGETVSYDFQYYVGIPRHIDMMIEDFYNAPMYEETADHVVEESQHEREIPHVDEEEGVAHLDEEGKGDGDNWDRDNKL